MRTRYLIAIASVCALTACAHSSNEPRGDALEGQRDVEAVGYANYDTDGDGYIDETEYYAIVDEDDRLAEYDQDDDMVYDEDEFVAIEYDVWDANDDDMIDEDEFYVVTEYWNTQPEYATFEAWDADGDDVIEIGEFEAVYTGLDVYSDWDRDGDYELTYDEYVTGSMTYYDFDNDGFIETDEYIHMTWI